VVDEVVAATEDHARLDHGERQARPADDLLGHPLGPVVGARTVGTGAQEADEDDPSDTGGASRLDHVTRAVDVEAAIRLATAFAVDPGAQHDRIAAGEAISDRGRVGDGKIDPGPARQEHDLVPLALELPRQVPADESVAAGDRGPHRVRHASPVNVVPRAKPATAATTHGV
jgi:hypothetical protein